MNEGAVRDPAAPPAEHPPGRQQRVVQPVLVILDVPGGRGRIDDQPLLRCDAQHPVQRDVRQPRLRIRPPHVGVRPREPHLHDALPLSRRLRPEVGPVLAAPFVQRDGVAPDPHVAVQPRVGELAPEAGYDADRFHRVPDTDEVRLAGARERLLEIGGDTRIFPRPGVDLRGIRDQVVAALSEKTADMQHAGQRPRREGAA